MDGIRPASLAALGALLAAATGPDPAIDRAVVAAFGPGEAPADFSASVERCAALVARVLPGWRWHVGWGVSGLLPYARLEHAGERASAEAPTVPIALLRALAKAAAGERDVPAPAPPRALWQR